MSRDSIVLLTVLFVMMPGGCQVHPRSDADNVETW